MAIESRVESIAIIGVGCRFPGAQNPQAFWQLLKDGVDAITEVPKSRWDVDEFYFSEPATQGKMSTRWGGFVEPIDRFDPGFFNISPREAEHMDPQQRLMLEVAWEALEDASIVPDSLAGSRTGVFVGVGSYDYHKILTREPENAGPYSGLGTSNCITASRVAYALDLKGPNLSVDTGCSSSLVATHYACQSLQSGESDLCMVGGVNVILSPAISVAFSQARMMSPTGRCKAFDASADGYVRGEGCGVVILKRLSDALEDCDRILAVIKGTAINQDGTTNGITAPNGLSQQTLIKEAIANAGHSPAQLAYIEAHGTGTPLGDPIEFKALKAVMKDRPEDYTCWVGSVKTNVGHLEAAAGMAGLIKVILSLHYDWIPPHLHLNELNPYISLKGTALDIPKQGQPWPDVADTRVAGVSGFSFGGTNCHLVIEEPPLTVLERSESSLKEQLLTLSAKDEDALQELAGHYIDYIRNHPSIHLAELCSAANHGRTHFESRLAISAHTTDEVADQLQTFVASGKTSGNIVSGQRKRKRGLKVAFLFTGQGSQYSQMGAELYEQESVFQDAIDCCSEVLNPLLEVSLQELLYGETNGEDESLLNQTRYTQPCLFAVEYALAQLWQSWGIEPMVVMGHSVGEYVAATVAGVFSLADGLRLIAERGRLMQSLPSGGGMLSVLSSEAALASHLAHYDSKISIAAFNGPESTVLSGTLTAIESLAKDLTDAGIKVKRLKVSHGFHSPLMEPILEDFREIAGTIEYGVPKIKLISNLTGDIANPSIITPDYWVDHLRQPVNFAEGMNTLAEIKLDAYVEVGTKPILLGMGRQCIDFPENLWLPSLRPGQGDRPQLLNSLAHLYVRGAKVNWQTISPKLPQTIPSLPTYPFQRQRYWVDLDSPHTSRNQTLTNQQHSVHPLLGQAFQVAGHDTPYYETVISSVSPAYLGDHCVFEQVIVPATAFLEMVLAAAEQQFKQFPLCVESAQIKQGLLLTDQTTLQTTVHSQNGESCTVAVYSRLTQGNWQKHIAAQISLTDDRAASLDLAQYQTACGTEVTVAEHYVRCGERGLNYGDCFQGITQLWRGDSQAIAQVQLPASLLTDETLADYLIHPALLDAAFQVLTHAIDGNDRRTYLPISLEKLTLYRRPTGTVWALGEVSRGRRLRGTLTLMDSSGEIFARLEGLRVIPVTMKSLLRRLQPNGVDENLYQLTWVQKELQFSAAEVVRSHAPSPQQPPWLLFLNQNTPASQQLSTALVQKLTEAGHPSIRVLLGTKYAQLDEHCYQIRANHRNDLAQLLETIPTVQGIAYLWGTSDSHQPWQIDQAQNCGTLIALVQELAHSRTPEKYPLWVVTRGTQSIASAADVTQPQQASLWGLGRVITLEHPELQCRYIDLEAETGPKTCGQLLVQELLASQGDDNSDIAEQQIAYRFAYRQQQRYVARLERHAITPLDESNEAFQLRLSDYGLIDNLHLSSLERRTPNADEVEIAVDTVGLNFRDVLNTLGLLKDYYKDTFGIESADQLTFGFECAGRISTVGADVTHWQVGDEVIATLLMDGFSCYITVNEQQVMAKPSTMTSAEAATLPLSYLTAYYGLVSLAQLKPGDTVLIHSAAGGVGQAAVQIAQHIGAEIYATASQGKWSALRAMGIDHVMDSRSLDFAEQILDQTGGQGVDVVLNSFNGDYIPRTLNCLATNGRFVEIGKLGIWSTESMAEARVDVAYYPFDLGEVATQEPETLAALIQDLSKAWESGVLKALPYKEFERENIQDAFRFMQQTRHVGKVVIQWKQPTVTPVEITAEGSYLITGGLGALGLEVAKGLVERGARHLALMGRRGPKSAAEKVIAALEKQGAVIALVQADVSNADDIERAFQQVAQELPPLKGIVHGAGLLDDGLLYQMDWAQMERVMAPKVAGSWYLHQQSQTLDLDFFVCFSSMAALLGSPGQGNYAAANAFMDGLMDYRRGQGLPGQSIHWGPWGEIGMAAQLSAPQQQRLREGGLTPLNPQAGIQTLFDLIQNRSANTAVLPIEWSAFLSQFSSVPTVFNTIAPKRQHQPVIKQQQQLSPVVQQLQTLSTEERRNFLIDLLRSQVAKVVGRTDPKRIGMRQSLFDLGLDSLMAIELKSQLESNLQISVGNTLLFDYPTIESLVDYLLSDSQLATYFERKPQAVALSQKNLSAVPDIGDTEPIAIVGMSCRFPGGVTSPEEFWQLLYQGIDGISVVPKSRWNIDEYYDADPDAPGKIVTRFGGFVSNAENFDAGFFGIAPREAESLDPQQRLLLEVSWEALERAHQVPESLFNSLTGVFIGICSNDYTDRLAQVDTPQAYWGTGNALSVAAGRLSYVLGLTGPSMSVDTACSSSLVSLHLACQSLRQGECNLALAGGVNLLLSPGQSVVFSQAGMLSPDGRCKTFDASANGYVRGEGCGILVLKRLSDAQRDGDNILAMVRGSAVNQDGPSGGLTVPNGPSQQSVIRQALANGGVTPTEVSYIEAHGTGTSLGDPIEVAALGEVFRDHGQANPLLIGSTKTNIGHLEGAAGVAGLMKVILQLQYKQIVPHLHFSDPNGYIDWDNLPVKVPTAATEWQPSQQNRIAGVSSFGFGGTNCHVVLQEAPTSGQQSEISISSQEGPYLLTLSAKSQAGLEAVAQRYSAYLQQSEVALAALSGVVNCDRTHFPHRLAILTDTTEELSRALGNIHADNIITGQATIDQTPTVAFLFTGQGSQYLHMGKELYAQESVFREAIDRCSDVLNQLLDIPLQSLLYPENNNNGYGAVLTERLNQTQYTQPVLFAFEYALAQLWLSWGIQPSVVMGHSVGEYVAATIAGVFSLDDGLRLIAERGRLMQSLPAGGGMLSVLASEKMLKPYLEEIESEADRVSIAAFNGPESIVLSGSWDHLTRLEDKLTKAGIKTKQLAVSHGFHSHLMDPILEEFRRVVDQATIHAPSLKLISNLTGEVANETIATADYWVNHIRQPVMFSKGMHTLSENAVDAYLEVGAKPILLGMGRQYVTTSEATWLPSLRPGQEDRQQMLNSLAQLYVLGAKVNWPAVSPKTQEPLPPLPTYPFQRQRYWIDPAPAGSRAVAKQNSAKSHPLLGQRLRMAGQASRQYETQIKASFPDYLYDHQVFDQVIMPATGFIEMSLMAGAKMFKGAALQLLQMSVERGLLLSHEQWTTLQTLVTKGETIDDQTVQQVELYSLDGADESMAEEDEPIWCRHCVAQVVPLQVSEQPVVDLTTYQQQCSEEISVEDHYNLCSQRGLNYGNTFQGIEQLWQGENQVLAKLRLPTHLVTAADFAHYQIHPALLDAAFQTLVHAIDATDNHTYLPITLEQLNFYQSPGGTVWVVGSVDQKGQGIIGQLKLVDSQGRVCAELKGLRVIQTTAQVLMQQLQPKVQDKLYQVSWQSQSLTDKSFDRTEATRVEASEPWLLLATPAMDRTGLTDAFTQAGQSCIWVIPGSTYYQLDKKLYQVSARTEDLVSLLQAVPNARGIVYLWSLDSNEVHGDTLASLDMTAWSQHQGCGPVLALVQVLVASDLEQLPPLYLVTQGTQAVESADEVIFPLQATVWGLGQVITLEHPELNCRRIDLAPELRTGMQSQTLVRELSQGQTDNQVAYRHGERFVPRLLRQQQVNAQRQQQQVIVPTDVPFQLKLSDYGLIDNLHLQLMERLVPQAQQVEIEVISVGLNFRDVLNALGLLQEYYREAFGIEQASQLTFGFECTGRIARVGDGVEQWQVGDEVMATLLLDGFSSYLTLDASQVMAKPTTMTFDQAATLPLSFLTAYYSLVELAKLQPGERVLIHSAAGGVGQAAVQIAQAIGAEIYATASPGKWDTLKQMGINHVMNSRTLEFAEEILKTTNGQGVSVVLNSFNGDFIDKSFDVLKQNGRFVEIGKLGIWSAEHANQVRPDAAYFPFDLGEVASQDPNIIATMAQSLDQHWEEGTLSALPHRVFAVEEIKDAFRFMQQAKHVGKVVVRWQPQAQTLTLKPDATYLITGGLGALGLHTAQGLVNQGAKHLVLMGRRDPSQQVQQTLDELLLQGTKVYPVRGDVTKLDDVRRIVDYIHQELPPLKGVIHAAGRLDDGLLHGLDWPRFEAVLAPKVTGTWNLHQVTQQQSLDFFVCFSSVASLLGSPGQGNYAAANAFMDSLMQWRRRQGLPGVSINWGPWADGGMAAQLSDKQQARVQANGISPLTTQQGLMALSQVAMGNAAQVGVFDINWHGFLAQFGRQPIPDFFDAFMGQKQQPEASGPPPLLLQLEAAPIAERTELLTELLRGQVAKVLGLKEPLAIDVRQPLFDLGLDSLMAVELKKQLETSLDISVGTTLLFDYPSIEALTEYLTDAERLPIEFVEVGAPSNEGLGSMASPEEVEKDTLEESLGDLSDLELAQLLAAELDLENV